MARLTLISKQKLYRSFLNQWISPSLEQLLNEGSTFPFVFQLQHNQSIVSLQHCIFLNVLSLPLRGNFKLDQTHTLSVNHFSPLLQLLFVLLLNNFELTLDLCNSQPLLQEILQVAMKQEGNEGKGSVDNRFHAQHHFVVHQVRASRQVIFCQILPHYYYTRPCQPNSSACFNQYQSMFADIHFLEVTASIQTTHQHLPILPFRLSTHSPILKTNFAVKSIVTVTFMRLFLENVFPFLKASHLHCFGVHFEPLLEGVLTLPICNDVNCLVVGGFAEVEGNGGMSALAWKIDDFVIGGDIKVCSDHIHGSLVNLGIVLRTMRHFCVAEPRVVVVPEIFVKARDYFLGENGERRWE